MDIENDFLFEDSDNEKNKKKFRFLRSYEESSFR